MLDTKVILTEHQEVIAVSCDCCGRVYTKDQDELEIEEFQFIRFIGGYGSIFGDGNSCEVDICQHCVDTMLGKFIRIANDSI